MFLTLLTENVPNKIYNGLAWIRQININVTIKPIKIKIKDNWKFSLVAYLVDREDFLNDIGKARKKLGLVKVLPRKKIEEEFKKVNKEETLKKYKKESREGKEFIVKHQIKIIAPTKYDQPTIDLLRKYRKSDNFHYVVKFAMISGEVQENDLQDTSPYIFIANPNTPKTEVPTHAPQVAMIINPESNPAEIVKSLSRFKRNNNKIPINNTWFLPSESENAKRDRKWYWLQKSGKSAEKISGDGKNITAKGVEQAIKRYREKLNLKLY